jgi:predicted NUDIX family phosphoesterase
MSDKMKKHILAVDIVGLREALFAKGIVLQEGMNSHVDFETFLECAAPHIEVSERGPLERNLSKWQLLPYFDIEQLNESPEQLFYAYLRGTAGNEPKLHGLHSCGFGGHIDDDDVQREGVMLQDRVRVPGQADIQLLSDVLNKVTGTPVKIEGSDILFSEPDRNIVAHMVKELDLETLRGTIKLRETLTTGAMRELLEELVVTGCNIADIKPVFNGLIIDHSNDVNNAAIPVGAVHLGLSFSLQVPIGASVRSGEEMEIQLLDEPISATKLLNRNIEGWTRIRLSA